MCTQSAPGLPQSSSFEGTMPSERPFLPLPDFVGQILLYICLTFLFLSSCLWGISCNVPLLMNSVFGLSSVAVGQSWVASVLANARCLCKVFLDALFVQFNNPLVVILLLLLIWLMVLVSLQRQLHTSVFRSYLDMRFCYHWIMIWVESMLWFWFSTSVTMFVGSFLITKTSSCVNRCLVQGALNLYGLVMLYVHFWRGFLLK